MLCTWITWSLWITGVLSQGVVFLTPEEQQRRYLQKWVECQQEMNRTDTNITGLHCSRVWDDIMCWSDTPAGTTVQQPCPSYINKFDTNEFATRECLPNGTWFSPEYREDHRGWTNYSTCESMEEPKHPKKHEVSGVAYIMMQHIVVYRLMYNIGYGISLVSLSLAVVIMVAFKKLHCSRNYIHLNLFVSFLLRALMNTIRENCFVQGLGFPIDVEENENGTVIFKDGPGCQTVYIKTSRGVSDISAGARFTKLLTQTICHWECRLFYTIYQYVLMASYMWIFVEAVYLHMLIFVSVFTEKTRTVWYMIFGWSLPLPFAISWAIARACIDNTLCWNTSINSPGLTWINKSPVMISVIVNFFFFLNIVRLLFTKLNNSPCPDATRYRYKRLARSVLVLIPVFGVYYLVFTFPMDNLTDTASFVMLFIEMFFNSYQGLIIAILLCFVNGEVRSEIKKAWARRKMRRSSTVTRFSHVSTTQRRSSAARIMDSSNQKKPTGKYPAGNKSTTSFSDMEETVPFTHNASVNSYSMVMNGKTATETKPANTDDKKTDEVQMTIKIVNIECQSSDGNRKHTTSFDIQTLKNGCPLNESKVTNNNTEDGDETTSFLP